MRTTVECGRIAKSQRLRNSENTRECDESFRHDAAHPRLPKSQESADADLSAFTIIELLIASAIVSLVIGLLASIIIQIYQVTAQATSRLAVLGDLTLAGEMLGRDINSASVAIIADQSHLTLTQPDPQGGPARTVVYTVAPPLLLRDDGSGNMATARYVTAETMFSPQGVLTGTRLIGIRLASDLGNESQVTTIQLALRPQP